MKLIQPLIITLFLFAFSTMAQGQEKYEYGQVAYNMSGTAKGYTIATSISGVYQVVEDGRLADGKINSNFVPVNKVINDLAEKGWEVYNTAFTQGQDGVFSMYYLRKKKP